MSYTKMLLHAHAMEVAGEAAYRVAAAHARTLVMQGKWQALAQLEEQTLAQLREELSRLGVVPGEARAYACLGAVAGCVGARLPWPVVLWVMVRVTRHATEQWRHMQAAHRADNPVLMQALVDHELAQETFARLEQQGRSQAAWQAIQAALAQPQAAVSCQ